MKLTHSVISDVFTPPPTRRAETDVANGVVWVEGTPIPEMDTPSFRGISAPTPLLFRIFAQEPSVLTVFVSVINGAGNFTAYLPGATPNTYTDTSLSSIGDVQGAQYSIVFRATIPGSQLEVYWSVLKQPTLVGQITTPPDSVDLSTIGTADWAHWGLKSAQSVDRHESGKLIGNLAVIGGAQLLYYENNPVAFSWNNGVPDANVQASPTGVYVIGISNGFSMEIACGTSQMLVRVYVGVYRSRGKFQATLSDGSSPPFVDSSLENSAGTTVGVYTFLVQGSEPTSVLRLRWTQVEGDGNVTWQSVAVADGAAAQTRVVLQAASLTKVAS
jgi:hypothetical protein